MHQDQGRRLQLERALDDLAGIDRRVVDRTALLPFVPDQHVLAVEKQDVELLDLAMGDMRGAVIDQLVPRVDHRPLVQCRAHKAQCRLTRRFERGDPGQTKAGAGERVRLGAQQFRKAAETL